MSPLRTIVLAAACVTTAAALAACSSSSPTAGNAATTSSTAVSATSAVPKQTRTVTATPKAPAATATVHDSSAVQAGANEPKACLESQLKAAAATKSGEYDPTYIIELTFTNTSDAACTLTGYPGAALADKSGVQKAQAARVTSEPATTITLQPQAKAVANLEGKSTKHGGAQAGCNDLAITPKILVTPPNTTVPVPFAQGWPTCYTFTVHPVRLA